MSVPQESFVKEFNHNFTGKRTAEEKKKLKATIEANREEDSKMVTGKFKNLESKGGSLTFSYRKYKEDPYRTYTFIDGNTYTIPLGVAKHLNKGTTVAERDYAVGPDGVKKLYTIIKNRRERFSFTSTEYM